MSWLKELLVSRLDLKDLGEARQFLGLEIVRNQAAGTIQLLRRKFIQALLAEYGMTDCKPLDTPMFSNALTSLLSHLDPLTDAQAEYMRNKPFCALLGSLNWVGLGMRPDVCFALARIGQSQSNPHPAHWLALLPVLRYLNTTVDMGLCYSTQQNPPQLRSALDTLEHRGGSGSQTSVRSTCRKKLCVLRSTPECSGPVRAVGATPRNPEHRGILLTQCTCILG